MTLDELLQHALDEKTAANAALSRQYTAEHLQRGVEELSTATWYNLTWSSQNLELNIVALGGPHYEVPVGAPVQDIALRAMGHVGELPSTPLRERLHKADFLIDAIRLNQLEIDPAKFYAITLFEREGRLIEASLKVQSVPDSHFRHQTNEDKCERNQALLWATKVLAIETMQNYCSLLLGENA